MPFFNEPLIVVTSTGDSSIETNVPVEIPLYISDVNNVYTLTDFTSVEFYAYAMTGRDVVNLTELSPVTLTPSVSLTYTHTSTLHKDFIYFMFKISTPDAVHWISTDKFKIIKTGV